MHRLTALRTLDVAAWRREVRDAIAAAGSVPRAAQALGIGERTLWRWTKDEPGLTRDLVLPKLGGPRVSARSRVPRVA